MREQLIRVSATCAFALCVVTLRGADLPLSGSKLQNQQDSTKSQFLDSQLQRAIERRLKRDRSIPAHGVDVTVSNGIVNLAGTVDSLAAKWQASESVAEVRGVADVRNRLQVHPRAKVPDELLAARSKAALSEEVSTDLRDLRVHVQDGVVTVSGEVHLFQERLAIDEIVSRLAGARGLRNLAVLNIQPQERPDSEMEADVVSRIAWTDSIDSENIEVEVHDGVARLSGTVASVSAKRRAVQNAWVAGINRVDASLLEVARASESRQGSAFAAKSAESPDSGGSAQSQRGTSRERNNHPPLAEILLQRLQSESKLADDPLHVEISNGMATITGTVDTLHERDHVSEAAAEINGIKRIYNLVKIRPRHILSDAVLVSKVEEAIERDAYLQEYGLFARADNGRIRLYGTVESGFELRHAYDVVSRVPGVITIDNNLFVPADPARYYYRYPFSVEEIYDRSDEAIQQSIEHQLFWSPFVDGDEVSVEVEKSGATLTGSVDSLAEKRAAEENAYEGGATEVHNHLKIGDPGVF